VACLEEPLDGDRADIAGTASYEDAHGRRIRANVPEA
jgi:hypothetical protein